MFCWASACDGASAVRPIKAARQAGAVIVRFIDKPLLYCDVDVFRLLSERWRASGEEGEPDHLRAAFAKSTDVFQMVKFIRAMLLMVGDGMTAPDARIEP